MMLPKAVLDGVVEGRIKCAFRRWDTPRVKVGGTQLTAVGLIRFDSVRRADPAKLREGDARSAGIKDLATLRRLLDKREEGSVYRIGLSLAGPDPRWELREVLPDAAEIALITEKLDRMDAGPHGPWTRQVLVWIRQNPGVVSTVMAEHLDRERWGLKTDIRRMKALGLTISLEVGYQLSPRGAAYLEAFGLG